MGFSGLVNVAAISGDRPLHVVDEAANVGLILSFRLPVAVSFALGHGTLAHQWMPVVERYLHCAMRLVVAVTQAEKLSGIAVAPLLVVAAIADTVVHELAFPLEL